MIGILVQIGININIVKVKIFRLNILLNVMLDFKGNEMEIIENIINFGSIKLEILIYNINILYIIILFIFLDFCFIICVCKFMNDYYIIMFVL